MPYDIHVLRNGSCDNSKDGYQVTCTVTLLKGDRENVLVDTGSAWDTAWLRDALAARGLSCDDVTYVIGTHGHSDHIGNLNLFTNATHVVCHDINRHNAYQEHPFNEGVPYVIDESLSIESTPGHTCQDISAFVQSNDPRLGLVVVCGDAFESERDTENDDLWRAHSQFPEMQAESRAAIMARADYIIPGHGPMFKSPKVLRADSSSALTISSCEEDE